MRTFCRNDDIIIRTAESFFVIKEPHKECNVINYYCRGANMREMEFKVERNGLLKEGDIVNRARELPLLYYRACLWYEWEHTSYRTT